VTAADRAAAVAALGGHAVAARVPDAGATRR